MSTGALIDLVFLIFAAGVVFGLLLAVAYPEHFDIRESPLRPGPRDPSEPS